MDREPIESEARVKRTMHAFFSRIALLIQKTIVNYGRIDADQRAAAFAYYAFLSLIPLLLLFVALASMIPSEAAAPEYILNWLNTMPALTEGQQNTVLQTITTVLESRTQAGVIAIVTLAYTGGKIFQSVVRGINAAWGFPDSPWWHMPFKNFFLTLVVAAPLFLGLVAPVIAASIERVLLSLPLARQVQWDLQGWIELLQPFQTVVPWLMLFYAAFMVYKLSPSESIPFQNIWLSTVVATLFLQVAQQLFFWFINNFGRFNAIYGTLSTIVILLLWLFLSGNIIFIGACMAPAHAEVYGSPRRRK